MGWPFSKNKSKKETKIENTTINETTFEALNRSVNATNSTVISEQNLSINGATFICKEPQIKQIANLDVKVLSKFEGKDSANLVDDIMNKMDGEIDDSMDQVSGMLSIGGGNENNQKTEVKNSIRNSLKKSITNEVINTMASKVVANQRLVMSNLIVDPCGMYAGIKQAEKLMSDGKMTFAEFREATKEPCDAYCGAITQDVQIKFVAEQLGSKINESVAQNKTVQDIKAKLESHTSQKTKGVGDVAKDVGTGIGEAGRGVGEGIGSAGEGIGAGIGSAMGGMMMPFIVSGIACVICMMVFAFMFKSKPGDTKNLVKMGMSKIPTKMPANVPANVPAK